MVWRKLEICPLNTYPIPRKGRPSHPKADENHTVAHFIMVILLKQTMEIMETHYYNVNVNWNQDRKGMMCSPELNSPLGGNGCIEVATPPEFPKGVAGIWSPEHLFTASVASCIMTTFLAIAENSKLAFAQFGCNAKGKLEKTENGYEMTEVLVEPRVALLLDKDRDRALRVLEKTEKHCLISNSIKSKVIMKPILSVAGPKEQETA